MRQRGGAARRGVRMDLRSDLPSLFDLRGLARRWWGWQGYEGWDALACHMDESLLTTRERRSDGQTAKDSGAQAGMWVGLERWSRRRRRANGGENGRTWRHASSVGCGLIVKVRETSG